MERKNTANETLNQKLSLSKYVQTKRHFNTFSISLLDNIAVSGYRVGNAMLKLLLCIFCILLSVTSADADNIIIDFKLPNYDHLKGVNYDPVGTDACDWGCPVDANAITADIPVVAKLKSREALFGPRFPEVDSLLMVRMATPASPLLLAPIGETLDQANEYAATNLNTMLSGLKTHQLTPLLYILGWCYTPGTDTGCYNIVTKSTEPNNERAPYEEWLTNLVKTSGVTAFEIGNEENLNAFIEASGLNPDQYASGWRIPDCQLDDPTATVSECANGTNKNTGINPDGLCDGSVLSNGFQTPNGPPQDYTNAVQSYLIYLRDTYQTIKAANPEATVVIGGISSWHADCFIDVLARLGGFAYADAVAFHPYPTPPNGGPIEAASTVGYLVNKLRSIGHGPKIWITEFGFSTDPAAGIASVTSETEKSQYIQDEWNALTAMEGVSGPIFLYQARDYLTNYDWGTNDGPLNTAATGYGLYQWNNGNLIELPAFETFQNLRWDYCRNFECEFHQYRGELPFPYHPVIHRHFFVPPSRW